MANIRGFLAQKSHNSGNEELLELKALDDIAFQTLERVVLQNFYQELKNGGFLLLGKAETLLGVARALFHGVDIRAKLFRKGVFAWLKPIPLET